MIITFGQNNFKKKWGCNKEGEKENVKGKFQSMGRPPPYNEAKDSLSRKWVPKMDTRWTRQTGYRGNRDGSIRYAKDSSLITITKKFYDYPQVLRLQFYPPKMLLFGW